jgi:hypothetical protein
MFAPAVAALALLSLAPGAAHAGVDDPDESSRSSYWHASFLGGVVLPLGDMEQSHDRGLAVGGRLGWTSKLGLGLEVAGTYSPLPRGNLMELETYEIHYATGTVGPRMTLGRGTLRVWAAAGGGVAFERARQLYRMERVDTTSATAPAASAAAGVELHFLSSGGLSVTGNYTRTIRDLQYEYLDVKAGLVFTF